MILAPEGAHLTPFKHVVHSAFAGCQLLHKLQSFRGQCYLRLGALQEHQLHEDGRHVQHQDFEAWHLVSLTETKHLAAGLRFVLTDHKREFQIGGWCVEEKIRGSRLAFEMLMASYALADLLGVRYGCATATSSLSKSAEILKKIGGEFVRSYYDEHYNSHIEEIRFDLHKRNPRFEKTFQDQKETLRNTTVIFAPGLREFVDDAGHFHRECTLHSYPDVFLGNSAESNLASTV